MPRAQAEIPDVLQSGSSCDETDGSERDVWRIVVTPGMLADKACAERCAALKASRVPSIEAWLRPRSTWQTPSDTGARRSNRTRHLKPLRTTNVSKPPLSSSKATSSLQLAIHEMLRFQVPRSVQFAQTRRLSTRLDVLSAAIPAS